MKFGNLDNIVINNFQLLEINEGRKKERSRLKSILNKDFFTFLQEFWSDRGRADSNRFYQCLENVSIRSKVTESRNRDESIAKKKRRGRIFDGCAKLRKLRDRNRVRFT